MARDLQVTFRNGRLMAAYLHLQKRDGLTVAHSRRTGDGMIVDLAPDGTAIGIEFVAPSKVSLSGINQLLQSVGQTTASADELWPLVRAPGISTPAA
jgi:uncharacterized protein YuzE